jgi:hypothetical protein
MESGILYLAISIAHFIGWFGHSNFAIYMLGTMVSLKHVFERRTLNGCRDGVVQNRNVIGIAFNLIIIRTAANRAEDSATHSINKLTTLEFNSQTVESVQYMASIGTDEATVYP